MEAARCVASSNTIMGACSPYLQFYYWHRLRCTNLDEMVCFSPYSVWSVFLHYSRKIHSQPLRGSGIPIMLLLGSQRAEYVALSHNVTIASLFLLKHYLGG